MLIMKSKKILLLSLATFILSFCLKSNELNSSSHKSEFVAQGVIDERQANFNMGEILDEIPDNSLMACGDGCDPETECCHYCQVNACLYRSCTSCPGSCSPECF
jgi:hypothetical protein